MVKIIIQMRFKHTFLADRHCWKEKCVIFQY